MTLYNLHKSLKQRVETAAENAGFHGLKVFIHNMPSLKYENDAEKNFPCCVVMVGEGEDGLGESVVSVTLNFGTKDESPKLRGHEEICHLIEIMRLSLTESNLLDGIFEIKKPINFALGDQQTETYPFFNGAVWFDVIIPSPGGGYNDLT